MSSVRYDYSGERVVVTGAAGLIGRALVARFAGAGARVLAVDRDTGGLEVFGDAPNVTTLSGDLAREDVADAVFARLDRLDVLVNNAAITGLRTR